MAKIAVAFMLMASAVFALPTNDRLYGGTTATAADFPYVVVISTEDRTVFPSIRTDHCSGFIYNAYYIITSASCVDGLPLSDMLVTVGATSLLFPDEGEDFIPVHSIKPYTGWTSGDLLHDIALIRLGRPIVWAPTAGTIYYNEVDDSATPVLTMAGFGTTVENGLISMTMRTTTLDYLDQSTACAADYPTFNSNYMVCAGSATSGPCQFDEGTPLVQTTTKTAPLDKVAVGVLSQYTGCGGTNLGKPAVFTKLVAYYSWIRANAGQQPILTGK